ncbi:MAG: metal-dependent transcriptional regulator [Chloroflexi bacterium]|nr:metal-dependent transcriptional regulator [Chloroflexota bacterium]
MFHELDGDAGPQLRRLVELGFVEIDRSGAIALTESGREQARGLMRRHRLAERLFTDVLDLDWASAHAEADRLEHVIDPEAEAQLATMLGDPATCPHGNPIPGAHMHGAASSACPLTECPPATDATITRIASETPAMLQHLATLGLLPEVEIGIENRAPFDGPVMICVGRAHYALGRGLAARIWVRRHGHGHGHGHNR